MALDRRAFLSTSIAALAAGLPRVALAAAPTDKRFVLVILRGGMDGLAAVPPYGDRDYRNLRGALALPAPGKQGGTLDLDGFFGLHPALQPIHGLFAEKQLAIVHAVASPYRDRSHFDAQDLLENGTTKPHAVHDGWLNRALGLMSSERKLGLAVGQTVPLVLRGTVPVASWAPVKLPDVSPEFLDRVADLYRDDPVFGPAFAAGLGDQAMIEAAMGESGLAELAAGPRAQGLVKNVVTTVANLLSEPDGPRIAVVEILGWDTHANQGASQGRLATVLQSLGDGLAVFKHALGPAWRDTVVLTLTEFGRTAAVNGTGGTDHGTASAALLLGGAVKGGQVFGQWPGLARARLYQGRDLAPTTDSRAICKAILRDQLGLPGDALDRHVFPGSAAIQPMAEVILV